MARSDWRRPSQWPLEEGKRRMRLTVAYDGTPYNGWQRQQNGRSVQEELEKALRAMLKEPVEVFGSGRTDSGVHALGQVCHFDISSKSIPAQAFVRALNQLLPHDVRVMDSAEVDGSFHARFSTMAREYRYLVKEESGFKPFDRDRVAKVRRFPDFELLNSYAACVEGTHDFSTFTGAGDLCPSKFRDIYVSRFSWGHDFWGDAVLVYTICGNAFLYRMVRSLVGTMLQLGGEGASVEEFRRRLESKDRSMTGRTASAGGLYLSRISYDGDEFAWFEPVQNGPDMSSDDAMGRGGLAAVPSMDETPKEMDV